MSILLVSSKHRRPCNRFTLNKPLMLVRAGAWVARMEDAQRKAYSKLLVRLGTVETRQCPALIH